MSNRSLHFILALVCILAEPSWGTVTSVTRTVSVASCSNVTGTGSIAWSNPTNADANIDAWYTGAASLTSTSTSNWLQCINLGFTTADIPAGSTTLGITVGMQRYCSSTTTTFCNDNQFRLVKDVNGSPVIQSADRATSTTWPLVASVASEAHGSSTDVWDGETAADIISPNFGVAMSAKSTSATTRTGSVDGFSVTITYSLPATFPISSSDGYIQGGSPVSYANARSTSSSLNTSGATIITGQSYFSSAWNVYRGYIEADTSSIPAGSNVTAVTLYGNLSVVNANYTALNVAEYNWTSPLASGTQEADYDGCLAASTRYTLCSTCTVGWNTGLTLGTSWVKTGVGGVTRYCLLSQADINNTAPTTIGEKIYVNSQESTGALGPQLAITWQTPTPTSATPSRTPTNTPTITPTPTNTPTLTPPPTYTPYPTYTIPPTQTPGPLTGVV